MVKRVLKSSVFNYIEFDIYSSFSSRVKEEGLDWRRKHGGVSGPIMPKAVDWMDAPRQGAVIDEKRGV